MDFKILLIIYLFLILYGVVLIKRLNNYTILSLTYYLYGKRTSDIDWKGYRNLMGNGYSLIGFFLIAGWIGFYLLSILKLYAFYILFVVIFSTVWGLNYSDKRFDKHNYNDLQRESKKIKIIEYKNLDLVLIGLSFVFILIKLVIIDYY